RQNYQPKADAVYADVVARANCTNPGIVFFEVESGGAAAYASQQKERNDERDCGEPERNPAMMRFARAGREAVDKRRRRADNRQQNKNCEQIVLHSRLIALRSFAAWRLGVD